MRKTLIAIAAAVLPAGAWAMSEHAMNEEIMAQCAMLLRLYPGWPEMRGWFPHDKPWRYDIHGDAKIIWKRH